MVGQVWRWQRYAIEIHVPHVNADAWTINAVPVLCLLWHLRNRRIGLVVAALCLCARCAMSGADGEYVSTRYGMSVYMKANQHYKTAVSTAGPLLLRIRPHIHHQICDARC